MGHGCAKEVNSMSQQRASESSGGGGWLGSREAGQNKQSDIPP